MHSDTIALAWLGLYWALGSDCWKVQCYWSAPTTLSKMMANPYYVYKKNIIIALYSTLAKIVLHPHALMTVLLNLVLRLLSAFQRCKHRELEISFFFFFFFLPQHRFNLPTKPEYIILHNSNNTTLSEACPRSCDLYITNPDTIHIHLH